MHVSSSTMFSKADRHNFNMTVYKVKKKYDLNDLATECPKIEEICLPVSPEWRMNDLSDLASIFISSSSSVASLSYCTHRFQ